jgi:hypothetical protein
MNPALKPFERTAGTEPQQGHFCKMGRGIWTAEHFICTECGMSYTATKEQHPDKHSGSFECRVCSAVVHAWTGFYDFFDWKTAKTASPVFGKKKSRQVPPAP